MFMEVAEVFARRSTCMRLNVGAVIVAGKTIIAHGYNGPPSGEPHCSGKSCCEPGKGCHRARHAEHNALERIFNRYVMPLTMYVTDSPCVHCFDRAVQAGISAIYFRSLYRVNDHLMDSPIPLYRMTPSGFLIDYQTGELVDDA